MLLLFVCLGSKRLGHWEVILRFVSHRFVCHHRCVCYVQYVLGEACRVIRFVSLEIDILSGSHGREYARCQLLWHSLNIIYPTFWISSTFDLVKIKIIGHNIPLNDLQIVFHFTLPFLTRRWQRQRGIVHITANCNINIAIYTWWCVHLLLHHWGSMTVWLTTLFLNWLLLLRQQTCHLFKSNLVWFKSYSWILIEQIFVDFTQIDFMSGVKISALGIQTLEMIKTL